MPTQERFTQPLQQQMQVGLQNWASASHAHAKMLFFFFKDEIFAAFSTP